MKLSTLKRKAAKQAKEHGHKLKWGNVYGTPTSNSQNGFCRHCKAGVACHENMGMVHLYDKDGKPTINKPCLCYS
jgi:hypothetical protein